MKELIDLELFLEEIKKYSPQFAAVCAERGKGIAIMYLANGDIDDLDTECPYQYVELQEERADGEGMEQWYIFKRRNELGNRFFVVWIYKGKIEEDFLREVRKNEAPKPKWE
jgi:hypothetical protein